MSSLTNVSGRSEGLRIVTFNIAKSYFDLDVLVENAKDLFDVDDQHGAIRLIADQSDSLPPMDYMGGDFTCHLREWDDHVPHHRT
jgi:hypothetical protein